MTTGDNCAALVPFLQGYQKKRRRAPSERAELFCSAQPSPSASCQIFLTHLILQTAQKHSFVYCVEDDHKSPNGLTLPQHVP